MKEISKKGGTATLKAPTIKPEMKKSDVGLVRIQESDKRFLEKMSMEFGGESMSKVLHRIIDEYRRNRYFKLRNDSYAALMADSEAWTEHLAERNDWDNIPGDD